MNLKHKNTFPYNEAELEEVPCNLCKSADSEIIGKNDRNGLKIFTRICRCCGLIYISPRMTHNWYNLYYQKEYRIQMAKFKGKPVKEVFDHRIMFKKARLHGQALARLFYSKTSEIKKINNIAEVGSSVGGVLAGFKDVFPNLTLLGIELSAEEANFANKCGIQTYISSIEDMADDKIQFSAILCTQSLNHFLSPRHFFLWAYNHLTDGGFIILETMNFRHVWKQYGCKKRAIQIDHVYMFVPETFKEFIRAAGFEIIHYEDSEYSNNTMEGLPGKHMRAIARKTSDIPFHEKTDKQLPLNLYNIVFNSLNRVPDFYLRYYIKNLYKSITKVL